MRVTVRTGAFRLPIYDSLESCSERGREERQRSVTVEGDSEAASLARDLNGPSSFIFYLVRNINATFEQLEATCDVIKRYQRKGPVAIVILPRDYGNNCNDGINLSQ